MKLKQNLSQTKTSPIDVILRNIYLLICIMYHTPSELLRKY